jgi:hypothetical protein
MCLCDAHLAQNRGDATATHTSGIFGLQYRKNNELSIIAVVRCQRSGAR